MKRRLFFLAMTGFLLLGALSGAYSQARFQVTITSNVRGADVYVNGKRVGQAPITIPIFIGTHEFKVQANGYAPAQRVVTVKQNLTINLEMEKIGRPDRDDRDRDRDRDRVSVIRVDSNVRGAKVYIDNDYQGIVPESFRVKNGRHQLKVTADGYTDYISTIDVNRDLTIQANLEQERRTHTLSVDADVRGARVYINGDLQNGTAPLRVELERGRYTVKVIRRGFAPYEVTINLNRDTKIDAKLRASNPEVSIIIPDNILNNRIRNPEDRIDVFVDGRKQRGFDFSVDPGRHRIRVEIGPLVLERDMNFRSGNTYTIKIGFAVDIDEDRD